MQLPPFKPQTQCEWSDKHKKMLNVHFYFWSTFINEFLFVHTLNKLILYVEQSMVCSFLVKICFSSFNGMGVFVNNLLFLFVTE